MDISGHITWQGETATVWVTSMLTEGQRDLLAEVIEAGLEALPRHESLHAAVRDQVAREYLRRTHEALQERRARTGDMHHREADDEIAGLLRPAGQLWPGAQLAGPRD